MADPIRIGRLRWRVRLVRRDQAAQPLPAVGIDETADDELPVHADIQPFASTPYFQGVLADPGKAPTHRIILRWRDYLDQTYAVIRTTLRPDGSARTETFRVRRYSEIEGRKRFVALDCEIEQAS